MTLHRVGGITRLMVLVSDQLAKSRLILTEQYNSITFYLPSQVARPFPNQFLQQFLYPQWLRNIRFPSGAAAPHLISVSLLQLTHHLFIRLTSSQAWRLASVPASSPVVTTIALNTAPSKVIRLEMKVVVFTLRYNASQAAAVSSRCWIAGRCKRRTVSSCSFPKSRYWQAGTQNWQTRNRSQGEYPE